MKKILFFVFFIAINSWLLAQDFESGINSDFDSVKRPSAYYLVQTGLNISKFHSTANFAGIEPEYFNLYGLRVAFMSEVGTKSPYFFKQFGISYSEMGTAVTKDRKNTVKLRYISLPLLFNFKIGTPVFKGFVGFGGYASLAFAGSEKEDGEIVNEDILGWQYGDGYSPKYYHYGDVGLLFGGGFQYILPNQDGIQISAHYGFGLIPISNSYPIVAGSVNFDPKEYNRNLNISVAYMFGKKFVAK